MESGWVVNFNGIFVIELLHMDGVHGTFTETVMVTLVGVGGYIRGGYTDQNWAGK